MRIACSRCEARYEVPDEKLELGPVKIRCSQCGHLFAVRKRAAAPQPPATPPTPAPEARFEDFNFGNFEDAAPAKPEAGSAPEESAGSLGDFEPSDMPSLGELDLGDFGSLDEDLDLRGEAMGGEDALDEEPLDRVQESDLMAPRMRDVQVQGLAEDVDRLDIQRGPRRAESATPSAMVARDRRRSPLVWLVVLVALGTAAFTGYNAYRHPEAFTFLNPAKLSALWRSRQMEARLGVQSLQGYYRDLPGSRRVFVIRGEVVNRAPTAQGFIRVRGELFDSNGATLAAGEVYCGNLVSEEDLTRLSAQAVEERLQNQYGEAMSNVDIAPGGKVPFMLVFPSPPEDVEKYSAKPVTARSGPSS